MFPLKSAIYLQEHAPVLSPQWSEARDITYQAIKPYITPKGAGIVDHDLLSTAAALDISVSELRKVVDFCKAGHYPEKLISNHVSAHFWIMHIDVDPSAVQHEEPPSISQGESFRRMRRRVR